MVLGNVWSKVGGAILVVVTFLQLETGLPHWAHVVIACIALFLGYILGVKTTPESGSSKPNTFGG